MESILLGISALLFVVFAVVVFGAYSVKRWGFPVARHALETYWSARWTTIDERLRDLEEDVSSLPRVWEEFSRDAKKAQERARWHVRRVKKELERLGYEDAEIDALSEDLRRRDGEGGNGQGLLPLHDALEADAPPPPDPITQALNRKWGRL